MLHVAGHFLGADQHALDLRIGGAREIGTAVVINGQTGLREKLQSGLLKTALWDSDTELHRVTPPNGATVLADACCTKSVKQERVPRWQTNPAPSTSTRRSKVSRSQSVWAETTRRRLPELSPLVQSSLRTRLKKVTYPSCSVRSRAGRFINPTIRTSPSDES